MEPQRFDPYIYPIYTDTRNAFAKEGPMDPYVNGPNVVGLTRKTFKTFLKDVDAAFVLFYDPCKSLCRWAKDSIKGASEITSRINHVYAAVDCTQECELCKKQDVTTFPTLKLYARGIPFNTFDDFSFLKPTDMKRLLEGAPQLDIKPWYKEKCSIQ